MADDQHDSTTDAGAYPHQSEIKAAMADALYEHHAAAMKGAMRGLLISSVIVAAFVMGAALLS